MKRTSPRKAESHQRILRAAARAIRRHGYEGVGVAEVMKDAGLTHGGFYAHFDSRDALLAAAVDQAGVESTENMSRAAASAKPGEELMALVDSYLHERHVSAAEQGLGCAIAAAGTEIPRQAPEVRRSASRRIKNLIALIEQQFPGWGKAAAHEKAMGIAASLVGALMLARAVDDLQLSKAIRRSARDQIARAVG
jgi:TetR/AcrR family transcriptional regulator, transcriptional repressor for nem operon